MPVRAERGELSGIISRRIVAAILSGHYREGEVLPNEMTLSARLAVSRTALREAVKMLSAKGVVESRRRRGTLVRKRQHWSTLDPDLIAWTRDSGDATVSDELWAAARSALASLVAAAGPDRPAPTLVKAAKAMTDGAGDLDLDTRIGFLIELARTGRNRFLLGVVSVGLTSLRDDEPHYLRRLLSGLDAGSANRIVEALNRGDAPAVSRFIAEIMNDNRILVFA